MTTTDLHRDLRDRLAAAEAAGLPPAAAARLVGSSPAELRADAEAFADDVDRARHTLTSSQETP